MSISRVNFNAIGSGGDTPTGALVKLDANCADLDTRVTSAAAQAAQALSQISQSHIEGLKLQYVGSQAVTVSSGEAYIPGAAAIVQVAAAIAKTGLVLTANTIYHVYLFLNGSTPDIEFSTTAPVAYRGTACNKTGDTSRRYLGSVQTIAGGSIRPFQHGSANEINFTDTFSNVLAGGNATAAANVSLSSVLPVTARTALVVFRNASSGGQYAAVGLPGMTMPANYLAICSAGSYATAVIPCNASQAVAYAMSAAAGAFYMDVTGYRFER